MTTIQNVIVALFVIACAVFTCSLAGAQDVQITKGFTEVCTRVDENTLECTRFVKGKVTLVETCEVTKGHGEASVVVCSSVE